MNPRIHVLLPVHDRREVTRRFIDCLLAQSCRDWRLVLVDDGCRDGTADMVLAALPGTTVLRGDGNLWWAGALQRGLDQLASENLPDDDLVLFINDDVRFQPDYLERALALMAGQRGTLLLSRFADPDGGAPLETGVHADFRRFTFTIADQPERINCLSTRGLFAHWGDVKRIGGFRPRWLPHYGSDYEYTIRARRLGLALRTSAGLSLLPDHSTTGFHAIVEPGLGRFLSRFWSKRSPAQPLYLSAFVLLASDKAWMLPNLARIWLAALRAHAGALYRYLKAPPRDGENRGSRNGMRTPPP
jgi:GT2 family glycosyltransferase